MRSLFVLIALIGLPPAYVHAEGPPTSLRKLCIDTPLIVLAEALDPIAPTRFTVLLVMRGKGVRPGQTLAPAGLTLASVQSFDEIDAETGKPRPRRISQALLFLTDGPAPRMMADGLRLCTDDGRVLAPGPNGLVVRPQLRWPMVVARVRADVTSVEQVQACRRLARPERRTQALLDWVERRKGDFAAAPAPGQEDAFPAGWEDLQSTVFDWALEGSRPEDAWAVVKQYAELNRGETPPLRHPTFSTPEGRGLLLQIAQDDMRLGADRCRALHVLGERITLWPTAEERRRGARALTVQEQESLLDQLAALMTLKDELFRTALVQTIARLSWPEDSNLSARRTARALPTLMTTYKTASPGPARDELSTALFALTSPTQWTALTGNPAGVHAILRDVERQETTLAFWLMLTTGDRTIHEPPVLVLDRFGVLGFVAETRRLPLEVMNLDRGWAVGWQGTKRLAVRQAALVLSPGNTYRIRVEGCVGRGKDRQKWVSEPKYLSVPALSGPAVRVRGRLR